MAYWEREIRSLMGKAIHRFGLIQDGDRILVGVSGGKDSLSLLHLLSERRERVPIDYDLVRRISISGSIRTGERCSGNISRRGGLSFHVERSEIGKRAHSPENRENPCFLCSWERRKLIFHLARRLNCNKIAFGHHKDDIVETLLINMFYSAGISTMLPLQSLFKGKIVLIRPLALIEEKKIERFAREKGLPFGPSGCPSSGKTKRKEVKELIEALGRKNHRIKGNLFRSLSNIKLEYTLMEDRPASAPLGSGEQMNEEKELIEHDREID